MGITVGIDLGTTFSAVAWINPKTQRPEIIENSGGERITPSVIKFLEDGSCICGAEAKDAFEDGEYGCTSAFKRFMGTDEVCCSAYGKEYTARELSALLLAHLKKEAEATLGQTISEAVITVPAYFFNDEREDTIYAAKKAGLKVRQLVNEPTAAALNYGLKQWRENAVIMVYDLGGGTFDVTLVGMGKDYQMESIATTGDHVLGGKDWDDSLAELVMDKIYDETNVDVRDDQETKNEIKTQVETWKKRLSRFSTAECKVNVPGNGTVTVVVSKEEFDDTTRPLLDQTVALCEDVLRKKNLSWSNVTDVLLVGGSTRMPQVSEFLASLTGKKPLTHVNPDEAVALGAAMQTALKKEEYLVYTAPSTKTVESDDKKGLFAVLKRKAEPEHKESIAMKYSGPVQQAKALTDVALIGKQDVQAHGMGIISVNPAGTEYMNDNIIPPNMPIPVKSARAFQFFTSSRGDNELEIFVLEGEGEPLDCQINAKYIVSGIRHIKGGKTTIRVQYSFDRNSIIHVQVRQEDDISDLPIRKVAINSEELAKFGRSIDPDEFKATSDLSIVLAVDVSGSMAGSPLTEAKKAMVSFVNQYEDTGARIGVIIVSDRTEWVQYPTDDYQSCIYAINRIECDGKTGYGNSAHPFDEIERILGREDGTRYAIILADGVWYDKEGSKKGAAMCNRAGIDTAAIGFGSADKAFLDSLCSNKDLSILTQQSELTRSFGKIAQSIGSGGGSRKGRGSDDNAAETWETND